MSVTGSRSDNPASEIEGGRRVGVAKVGGRCEFN